MEEKKLTHLTSSGVHMVEVGDKPEVQRTAMAKGKITLQENTLKLIKKGEVKKGNILTTAQIAAIQAIKSTPQIIPLCHPLPISGVKIDFKFFSNQIEIIINVRSAGKTGVEMEALTGVSVGLLTIWDMVKSVEKDENGQYPSTKISDIVVLRKEKKELKEQNIKYGEN
jgi:cyclic pyranopterin monophosphate synthase